ncbi:hypothetical protein THAOC_23127 [Thalassiosira oceanica]|uniref:DUF6820 domain-containing protein n=1 Tax=Thalassiosira oceanica TaxID=159749 RepID=K0RST3_THAOC|nr:hypothetical protein THAOC_23127 [Thalassiosira oceanica]|eukprot:EJK56893.1 hypothetical protein THAOC_23127 [Thalassiosira oceanica]
MRRNRTRAARSSGADRNQLSYAEIYGYGKGRQSSPWQRRRLICKSELGREANRQRCRRGAAEEPNTDIGPEGGVVVPDGHAALQRLSSIPYLTSVATGFYRNDVINSSGTSAGRARLMMSEFAAAPARLIDNGGRRAIGIALRPHHFIGDDE